MRTVLTKHRNEPTWTDLTWVENVKVQVRNKHLRAKSDQTTKPTYHIHLSWTQSFPFTLICPRTLSNVFLRWHPAKTMKQSYNEKSHDHLSDSCVQLRTQPSWGWLLPWFWAAETWLLSSILQKIMGHHGVIGALNVPSKWNWNALKRLNTLKLCSHDMSWLPGSLVNIWLSWLCQQFHLRRVLPSHKENEDSKKSFRLHQLFALLHNANRTCMRT